MSESRIPNDLRLDPHRLVAFTHMTPELFHSDLSSLGVCALFHSQHITLGKYRNFTPAKTL